MLPKVGGPKNKDLRTLTAIKKTISITIIHTTKPRRYKGQTVEGEGTWNSSSFMTRRDTVSGRNTNKYVILNSVGNHRNKF